MRYLIEKAGAAEPGCIAAPHWFPWENLSQWWSSSGGEIFKTAENCQSRVSSHQTFTSCHELPLSPSSQFRASPPTFSSRKPGCRLVSSPRTTSREAPGPEKRTTNTHKRTTNTHKRTTNTHKRTHGDRYIPFSQANANRYKQYSQLN